LSTRKVNQNFVIKYKRYYFFYAACRNKLYPSLDYETWPGFSRVVLFLLMFVGGCFGSTGGGMKVIRIVILGNIGPEFGKIGPSGNYAFYPSYIKWFLSFIIMAGRLEIYTVLVLFTPTFWKR
jgi:Trk-type K+ transport system membrane component